MQAMSFISTDHSNNDNYNVTGRSTCNGETDLNYLNDVVTYRSENRFSGRDTVVITVTDQDEASTTSDVLVEVMQCNDLPTITYPTGKYSK